MTTALLFALSLSTAAHAKKPAVEEPPIVYELADLGLQVTFVKDWVGIGYSDKDLQAELPDHSIKFVVTASDVQVAPDAKDADKWTKWYEDRATSFDGYAPHATVSIADWAGTPVERADIAVHFDSETGPTGKMVFVSFPTANKTVHLLFSGKDAGKVDKAATTWLENLKITKPALPVEPGGVVEQKGIKTQLPSDWRAPTPAELNKATDRLSLVGVNDLDRCWVAIRTRAVYDPDLMAACQGGLYDLGIIDDETFASCDSRIRELLFGKLPTGPAMKVQLSDRLAFQYHITVSNSVNAVIAPYDQGIAKFWVLGNTPDDAELQATLLTAVKQTTFSGPYPVQPDAWITYYMFNKPLSPITLGSEAACLLSAAGLFGLLAMLGARSRRRAADMT